MKLLFFPVAMIGSLGMPELILIFLVFVLLFGASRLPKLGSSLGKGISNFKQSMKTGEDSSEVEENKEDGGEST